MTKEFAFDTNSVDMFGISFKVEQINSLNVYKNSDFLLKKTFLFHSDLHINSLICIQYTYLVYFL